MDIGSFCLDTATPLSNLPPDSSYRDALKAPDITDVYANPDEQLALLYRRIRGSVRGCSQEDVFKAAACVYFNTVMKVPTWLMAEGYTRHFNRVMMLCQYFPAPDLLAARTTVARYIDPQDDRYAALFAPDTPKPFGTMADTAINRACLHLTFNVLPNEVGSPNAIITLIDRLRPSDPVYKILFGRIVHRIATTEIEPDRCSGIVARMRSLHAPLEATQEAINSLFAVLVERAESRQEAIWAGIARNLARKHNMHWSCNYAHEVATGILRNNALQQTIVPPLR